MDKEAFTPKQIEEWRSVVMAGIEASGMTQVELAEKAGVSQSNFSQYQRGPSERMQFLTVARLFAALGLDLNEVAMMIGIIPDEREIPLLLKVYIHEIARRSEEEQQRILWVLGKLLAD